MDKLTLYSKGVELAEAKDGEDIHAKFCLCDFNTNRNGTRLNRDTIENWVSTIVNKPLVGRIRGGDFTGHNMKIVSSVDDEGNLQRKAEFDTEAFGTFTNWAIEKIDDSEVITAECDIWSRFTNVCELIRKRFDEGTLHTSWEIAVNEYHMDENDDKVIDDGRFTGLCVLGSKVIPAYESSMMIEAAETDSGDAEFVDALQSDLTLNVSEENNMDNFEISTEEVKEEEVSEAENVVTSEETEEKPEEMSECGKDKEEETSAAKQEEQEDEPKDEEQEEKPEEDPEEEVAQLTVCDIECKISQLLRVKEQYCQFLFPEEHLIWAKSWRDDQNCLDSIQYEYSVNGDEVTLGNPTTITLVAAPKDMNTMIAEKTDAIVTANETIRNLESEIAELRPYKEAAEAAEHAEKEAGLRDLAEKSGMFEASELQSGDVATMIAELDENKLKLCIADRYIAKQRDVPAKSVEVASAHESERNLYAEEDTCTSLLFAYINKK